MAPTIPQPPSPGDDALSLAGLHAQLAGQMADSDSMAWALEQRVLAIEEAAAARWPRRMLLASRLGRSLRASVRTLDGESFADRRTEAASLEWLATPRRHGTR